jgi:CheY-like chemotaxis protein
VLVTESAPAGDRLLIVEDDATAASLLLRALCRRGYQAETAASVEEALHLSAGGKYQAAIVDLRLGGDSGLRLVPALVSGHPDGTGPKDAAPHSAKKAREATDQNVTAPASSLALQSARTGDAAAWPYLQAHYSCYVIASAVEP